MIICNDKFDIIEGDEPPDYYVVYNSEKILLEVTRAEPIYYENGKIENVKTFSTKLIRLCDNLNKDLGEKLNSNKTLLYIKGPISNYSKFKNSIENVIESILADEKRLYADYRDWIKINVANNEVKLKLIDSLPAKKRIIGLIENKYDIFNIEEQVVLILSDRIRIKERKTGKINGIKWDGRKWLAIHNNYWLASSDTYISAINKLKVKHTFSKIFLIEEDYKVTEIYSED